MDSALDALEPNANGFIRQTFLEGEVEAGLMEIAQLTSSLTDEANAIMNQVADIVALPHLNDSDVQEGVRDARRKRDITIADLYEFDANQTRALIAIENDLKTMEIWISDIEGLFTDGVTAIDFPMDKWAALSAKNTLQTDLAQRTVPVAAIASMMYVDGQPGTLLGASISGGSTAMFGHRFQEVVGDLYWASVYTLPGMATWAMPIDGFNKEHVMNNQKVYPKSTLNPVMKSLNSFKEIGTDFVVGVNTRTDKALDSPSDFANYATLGISDGVILGAKSRADKMWNSPYDFTNYWTIGFAGTVKGALAAEDPLSKEHWLDSLGLATIAIGGVKAVAPKESLGTVSGKGVGNPPTTSKPLKGVNRAEGISRIDYLHNKYGKLTSEQLHQRINLRGETAKELSKLSSLTNKQAGPALAGVFNKTTGKYYFATNNPTGKVPEIIHPLIKERLGNMPKDVYDSYAEMTYGAGSHAEVKAINDALLANPDAKINDLTVNVVRSGKKLKPTGQMMKKCPHCAYITEGFEFISEVPKIGD
ncbi:T7SS effector LXG polymorphic toxin [Sporosarcina psychrophila]|uniref:LXG domain-containing protein n=1 Tax=Sporosarcina psychrophila TaxID=1476 RepID=A0ABV2K5H2_SPOPS